jgi:membrane fusion protein, multidrug efflux system
MRFPSTAVLALPLCLLLAGCKSEAGELGQGAIRPVLSVVVRQQTAAADGFAGVIEPRYQTNLGFRVLGRVIARDVNVGDLTTKGARLAALDPTALDLAVRSARAELSNTMAQLANVSASEGRQQILLEQKNISPDQFETVRQSRESADAAVVRARTALDKAIEQRGYAELTAEFDGVVTAIDVEVGQIVSPGQTVIKVARPDVREAVVDAPEEVGANLREGSPFQVSLQSDPSSRTAGRVREIAPQVDAMTHTRRIRVTLDGPPVSFRLGATITAQMSAPALKRVSAPVSALFEQDGKLKVWVVDPVARTVSAREVTVDGGDGQTVAVLAGLEAGDRVVTAGVHSLVAGQSVKLSEEATE